MRERLYNGDFFNFDFYIERTEGVYDGIDYEEAFKAFTYHILHESGPIEIGVDYDRLGNDGLPKENGSGRMPLRKFSKGVFTGVVDGIIKDKLVDKAIGNLDDFQYNYIRANKDFESIADMFKRIKEDCDYDSCDFDYDITVTVGSPEYGTNEPYDRYYNDVLSRVNVITDAKDIMSLCCDWSEFVYRYYDKLKDFADKNWRKNNFAEPEDFVYEWIDETQKLLAGYGTDSIYSALSEVIESEPNRDNEQYQNFIKNSFKPFMTDWKYTSFINNDMTTFKDLSNALDLEHNRILYTEFELFTEENTYYAVTSGHNVNENSIENNADLKKCIEDNAIDCNNVYVIYRNFSLGSENATCVTNASDNKIDIIRNNRSLIGYHADLVNVDSATIDLRNENFRNLNDERGVRI